MTENEAIEVLKDFGKQVSVKADGAYQSTIGEKACDIAIKALKEIQKYRKIEKDLKENYHANVDIPLLMKHFIETVFKGEKHEGFCILTNEDKDYEEATAGMTLSYSKKAYPWDNACIESFHSLLKREWINRFKIIDYNHAYKLVFEYIEAFYNTVRIHSHCDYASPNDYEKKYWIKLRQMEINVA